MFVAVTRRSILKSLAGTAASSAIALHAKASSAAIASHAATPASTPHQQREHWVALAQSLKRDPHEMRESPIAVVTPVPDKTLYLRWRMDKQTDASALRERLLRKDDSFILDFGGHRTGHFGFRLVGEGNSVDSPVRLKLTFGEVPGDVTEPFHPYKGTLSSAWLPEEIITVDYLPQTVLLPRRYAFRYVKVEVIDTSPNFGVRFEDVHAVALSATNGEPAPLPTGTPDWIKHVDRISQRTLRDCMQTSFEDGPRRDQRLWLGDMRLQAQASYVTYPNYDLVKRCLLLFAGLAREDGLVSACVFEKPEPLGSEPFLVDYSALFVSALLEYFEASRDHAGTQELFPVAKRQLEVLLGNFDEQGIYRVPKGEYVFIDWNRDLDYTACSMGVMAYALNHLSRLATLLGRETEVQSLTAQLPSIRANAHKNFYDPGKQLCISGNKDEINWATQAWMVLGGCLSLKEAQAAMLHGALENAASVKPATPYLYHYFAEALVACGMEQEALALLQTYWGGMANAGADTFWELYNPADSTYSPYGDVHINSFCHAWSCTPAWFFRALKLGLKD